MNHEFYSFLDVYIGGLLLAAQVFAAAPPGVDIPAGMSEL
jgi:hypothetical protein